MNKEREKRFYTYADHCTHCIRSRYGRQTTVCDNSRL